MWYWALLLILLWPLARILKVLNVARLLAGLEFRRLHVVALADQEIGTPLVEATKPWLDVLSDVGFVTVGAWKIAWPEESAFDEEMVVLVHDSLPVRALVRPYSESARSGEYWVELRSTTAGGREVATMAAAIERWTELPAQFAAEIFPTHSMRELLDRHLARLGHDQAAAWRGTTMRGLVAREQSICDGRYLYLHNSRRFVERGDGLLTYGLWPALVQAWRILREAESRKKPGKKSVPVGKGAALSNASQIAFDYHHYLSRAALKRGRYSLRVKALLATISFVLFAGAIGWRYTPAVAITLVVAVVVHECGHLWGMRMFGHRNTQLIFIPFLGAAAMAYDAKALKPWQEVVITLLGPLPGVFLGILLVIWAGSSGVGWLATVGWTFFGLNIFNLLPVLPLDGGRVVDFAVASRFPRARVFFLGGCALILVVLGKMPGLWMLYGVGVGMLFRLRPEWKLVPVRAEVRHTFPDGGEEAPIVSRLLEHMREPEWARTPSNQRLALVENLQKVLRMPRPGIFTMIFSLVAYTSPLWLGLPVAIWGAYKRGERLYNDDRAKAAQFVNVAPTQDLTGLTADDNAAPLYKQAKDLEGKSLEKQALPLPATRLKQVALLRTASHKKYFAPDAGALTPSPQALADRLTHGSLLAVLGHAGQETLQAQKPGEAVAIALDALWLERLFDASPRYWNWGTHRAESQELWHVAEAGIAGGAKLRNGQIADLRELTDEVPIVAFARYAIRANFGLVSERLSGMVNERASKTLNVMQLVITGMSADAHKLQSDEMLRGVVTEAYLRSLGRDVWPALPSAEKLGALGRLNIQQLANEVAELRIARVALTILERRAGKQKISNLNALGGAEHAVHPLTGAEVILDHTPEYDIVRYAEKSGQGASLPTAADEEDLTRPMAVPEFRLPVEAK